MNGNHLLRNGFLNRESEDLGVLASGQKLKYKFYCYSFSCAGSNDFGKLKYTGEEFADKCPDCKSRLFAKRLSE